MIYVENSEKQPIISRVFGRKFEIVENYAGFFLKYVSEFENS